MTRKYYNLLAQIIRQDLIIKQLAGQKTLDEEQMIVFLCHALNIENINFDRTRFKKACGI